MRTTALGLCVGRYADVYANALKLASELERDFRHKATVHLHYKRCEPHMALQRVVYFTMVRERLPNCQVTHVFNRCTVAEGGSSVALGSSRCGDSPPTSLALFGQLLLACSITPFGRSAYAKQSRASGSILSLR